MLILDPGSTTSNSYISLEEAEAIILNSGLTTPLWNSLNSGRGLRVTGTIAGPFLPVSGISDKLSFKIGDGSSQVITFPSSTTPTTTANICIFINSNVSGITASPTTDDKIKLTLTDVEESLTVETIARAANEIFGFIPGTYIDTVPSQKEYLLRLSAQLIGQLPLSGMRVCRNQALDFPRQPLPSSRYTPSFEVLDRTTAPENLLTIPDEVKEVQALLSCLVVLPNFAQQVQMSEDLSLPAALQNAIVNQVQVANVINVKTSAASSTSGTDYTGTTNKMESLAGIFTLPVYMIMKKYLSQIGGGSLISPENFDYLLYDEVLAETPLDAPLGD